MTDKHLAFDCIQMLEKYEKYARKLPNDNSKVESLLNSDMVAWKKAYYPQLVETGKIRDGSFFQNPLVNRNYGIGQDGKFTKYEYVQFLWRAYKFLMGDFSADSMDLQYIKTCIQRLEPYAAAFENHGTETSAVHALNDADMQLWLGDAYERLSKSGVIMDGAFFGDPQKDPRLGIGNDGKFTGEELCHFLFRLYQAAYRLLH